MRASEKLVTTKDGKTITLRSPEEGDAKSLLAFLKELLHESFLNLNSPADAFDQTTEPQQISKIKGMLDAERDFQLSAFCGEKAVGNLVVTSFPFHTGLHCGQLAMGILRSFQDQGLGTEMLRYAIETANRLGIWNIRFTVRTHNEPAIHLYERAGFHRVGVLKSVAKHGEKYFDEFLYQGIFRNGEQTV